MPKLGDKVFIRPATAHYREGAALSCVLADSVSGRFLPVEGEEATWSAHHAARYAHGEIVVTPVLESLSAGASVVDAGSIAPVKE